MEWMSQPDLMTTALMEAAMEGQICSKGLCGPLFCCCLMWQARYPGRVPSDAHTRRSPIPGRVLRFDSPEARPPTRCRSRCVDRDKIIRSVHAGSLCGSCETAPWRGSLWFFTESVGPNRNKVRNKSAPRGCAVCVSSRSAWASALR